MLVRFQSLKVIRGPEAAVDQRLAELSVGPGDHASASVTDRKSGHTVGYYVCPSRSQDFFDRQGFPTLDVYALRRRGYNESQIRQYFQRVEGFVQSPQYVQAVVDYFCLKSVQGHPIEVEDLAIH